MAEANQDRVFAAPTTSWAILGYFAPLILLATLIQPTGNLADIAVTFMLKDRLHASATQVSTFRLVSSLPLVLAFLIGMVRDHWNPLGRRDRGHLLIFASLSAGAFAALGFTPVGFNTLLVGIFGINVLVLFVAAAQGGLMALIGQERRMSGRLAVVYNVVANVPVVGGAFLGGIFAERVSPAATFGVLAMASAATALFALWKPRAIFDHVYDQPAAATGDLMGDVVRLFRTRSIYAPVLMIFCWNFAPAFVTPLQYHVTNELHASQSVYADFVALYFVGFFPFYLLYGVLLRRVAFRWLLWVGVAIGVPNLAIFYLVHTPDQLLALAVPMGALAAVGSCAMTDLSIRSCPRGLQGAMMLMTGTAMVLGYRTSDLLGSWLYDRSPTAGFDFAVAINVFASALCLPLILLVPRHVMEVREGMGVSPAVRAA